MTDEVKMRRKKQKKITNRQTQVLKLIATGKTNNEIAEVLSITIHTVKAHIIALYDLFNVNNRVSLVTQVLKLGVLSMNDI